MRVCVNVVKIDSVLYLVSVLIRPGTYLAEWRLRVKHLKITDNIGIQTQVSRIAA